MIRFLDNHGLLPQSLIDLTPFHASLLISNLASIRTNHIYHHVYEFGTTSIAITMGNMREVPRRTKDGIVFDRCMPLGVVMAWWEPMDTTLRQRPLYGAGVFADQEIPCRPAPDGA